MALVRRPLRLLIPGHMRVLPLLNILGGTALLLHLRSLALIEAERVRAQAISASSSGSSGCGLTPSTSPPGSDGLGRTPSASSPPSSESDLTLSPAPRRSRRRSRSPSPIQTRGRARTPPSPSPGCYDDSRTPPPLVFRSRRRRARVPSSSPPPVRNGGHGRSRSPPPAYARTRAWVPPPAYSITYAPAAALPPKRRFSVSELRLSELTLDSWDNLAMDLDPVPEYMEWQFEPIVARSVEVEEMAEVMEEEDWSRGVVQMELDFPVGGKA
ncbi:hypothetical protein NMY22_g15218 [Coprinellus aureogranulatus]|nr:hypothetical protein NMY22_g15218 [Coprinellus aureogranulatus]